MNLKEEFEVVFEMAYKGNCNPFRKHEKFDGFIGDFKVMLVDFNGQNFLILAGMTGKIKNKR